ncbi:histidinol-phosphatase HisJ [Sediminibacillus massiliensis]|uniref:histidinol-phosphatase HisJ n=1 Tax=Sediminibacillus massiliensis TaxID=1926277 RepID=UPI000988823D|nr:histidinol-phosphatase HisJ [Sediminibacillus massiliensis]
MNHSGDFHVHTNFCPHGTEDLMEEYIEKAIKKGLNCLSFTEHAPLPESFQDPAPGNDSSMTFEVFEAYLKKGYQLKEQYKKEININIGLEVDYIEGHERETTRFLNDYGAVIEDAILSVHMLKTPDDNYVCLDYSADEFGKISSIFGSVDAVYEKYYQTLKQAIASDLGKNKPTRMGHVTLIEKFSRKYPPVQSYNHEITIILDMIKSRNYQLDVNSAGLFKEHCQASYPPLDWINKASNLGIPLVPGSDSHKSDHLTRGFDSLPYLEYSCPQR